MTQTPTEKSARIDIDPADVRKGLGQLVVTLLKLLHELMERQAARRVDGGSLTVEQIERLGMTLMLQSREIQRLQAEFELADEDVNLDLGPLGKLL
ncbi:MAG: gas vesicle protein K [Tepidisphaeraceae bacterium]